MPKLYLKTIFLPAMIFIAGCSASNSPSSSDGDSDIPLIGQTEDGKFIEVTIPEIEYFERLKTAIHEVEESTMQALVQKTEQSKPFMLRSVVVGLGLNMEIKLGPIIKFGALPRFRVGFSNAKEPSFP